MRSFSRPLFIAFVCTALPSFASVVVEESLEGMARSAQVVVRGTAGPSVSRWNDEKTLVETWTEFTVTEALKGQVKGTLRVKQPGGTVPGLSQSVSGVAQFHPGEEALLFLDRSPKDPQVFVVRSLAMGKVSLEKNPLGEVRAVRDPQGLALYRSHPAGASALRPLTRKEDLGSDQAFLERVRRALNSVPAEASPAAPRGGR